MPEFSRHRFYLFLTLFSTLPFICYLFFKKGAVPFGLMSFIGNLFLVFFFEKKMQQEVSSLVKAKIDALTAPGDVEEYKNKIAELKEKYKESSLLLRDMMQEKELHMQEFERLKQEKEERIRRQESFIQELEHTIADQREVIERNKKQIGKLERKLEDLSYEIRSLLQMETTPPPLDIPFENKQVSIPPEKTTSLYDISLLLQKYLEKAEQFTTASHWGKQEGRFLDLSLDIDLRHFFDIMRDEHAGVVFIYSLLEKKMVFVGNHVKTLLGIAPERFVKEFHHLMIGDDSEWNDALESSTYQEKRCRITVLNKKREGIFLQARISNIRKGPLLHHVMGILTVV